MAHEKLWKCSNYGNCSKAEMDEQIKLAPGAEPRCPECGKEILEREATKKPPVPTWVWLIVGVVVILAAGAGAWRVLGSKTPAVQEPVTEASAANVGDSSVSASAHTPGIAPSDGETSSASRSADNGLITGNSGGAIDGGNRAAANEILKLAIAKMAQGKYDEAEKDLLDARARDPKQSLIAYNLGILRLKQNRKDDAMKEFEASFMAGFSYFDKMDQDPDLNVLRNDPKFNELVTQYRNRLPAK